MTYMRFKSIIYANLLISNHCNTGDVKNAKANLFFQKRQLLNSEVSDDFISRSFKELVKFDFHANFRGCRTTRSFG